MTTIARFLVTRTPDLANTTQPVPPELPNGRGNQASVALPGILPGPLKAQ